MSCPAYHAFAQTRNAFMGLLTKMSQLGHFEPIGNMHWERGSRVNTRYLTSLTMFR